MTDPQASLACDLAAAAAEQAANHIERALVRLKEAGTNSHTDHSIRLQLEAIHTDMLIYRDRVDALARAMSLPDKEQIDWIIDNTDRDIPKRMSPQ